MNRSALFGVGSAGVAMAMIVACQAIDGIHVYSFDPEGGIGFQDGGTVIHDGGTVFTGFGDAQCSLARPPARPDPASVTGTGEGEYVIAFSRLSFTGNGAALVGYDLDGVCTGEATEAGTGVSSCKVAGGGVAPKDTSSEAGDGVDAVLTTGSGQLQAFFNGNNLDALTHAPSDIEGGSETAFLVLDSYNLTPNDNQVTVSFATAEQIQSINCQPPDAAATRDSHDAPRFDGCDTWAIDKDTLLSGQQDGGGKAYRFVTNNAYVSNGYLVAPFSSALSLPVGSIVLSPTNVVVVAYLQLPDAGNLQIQINEGLIQGRLPAQSFLDSLSVVGDPLDLADNLCPGSPSFPMVQSAVCSQLDINSAGIDDGSAPCDSFTFASVFDGVSARLGTLVDGGNHTGTCPGDASSACP